MGRKKKILHDYAAEFADLVVQQHLIEHSGAGGASVVETLYRRARELPLRVRRGRILQLLSSGRHTGTADSSGSPFSSASDLAATGLPAHLCHPPLSPQPQPRLILSGSPSIGTVPPLPVGHTSLLPVNPAAISATTSDLSAQEDTTPSPSASHLSLFPTLQVKMPVVPSEQTNPRLLSEASQSLVLEGGLRCSHDSGAGVAGCLGLAIFGVGFGSPALLQSVADEHGVCLLYVVEDQL
ncbi:putative TP73 antisense gene protein 1 isoform X1 [Aotus nancymaae]|uniref:putative TP73 antisense gene protein 1 isoform X1 n=1 Tax=Aotus nancymaae TaxID=37293 RepID=UPI0030FF3DD0